VPGNLEGDNSLTGSINDSNTGIKVKGISYGETKIF
jgi:hypothetical protein